MEELKVYICGSIRGGRQDASRYNTIVSHLKTYGRVLNEVVGDLSVTEEDEFPVGTHCELHKTIMASMFATDVIIAEVTQPSLGVGYELGRAVERKIKTLILFRPDNEEGKKLSVMVEGAPQNEYFQVRNYNDNNMLQTIDDFMKEYILPYHQRKVVGS